MSAKNANNNAENAKNGKAAKSMTEHYTLGHKAVAVAMSTVMLGFGVPVNAPKDAYADSDAAAEQPADSDSTAKKSTEDSSAKKLESSAATDSSSAKSDSSSSKASSANSSSAKETAKAEQKTTADVALSLGNASIKYKGQTIAAPTTKVTVPTKNAFKFTVAADNGYTLTKVTVKVSGKESTLTADANGTYTVAAADVLAGASVKLVTEKQVQAQPAASTTPIQDTEADNSADQQPAVSPLHLMAHLQAKASRTLMPPTVRRMPPITLASPAISRVVKGLPLTMPPMQTSPIAKPKALTLRSCRLWAISSLACFPTLDLPFPVPRLSPRLTPSRLPTTVMVRPNSGMAAMVCSPRGKKAPTIRRSRLRLPVTGRSMVRVKTRQSTVRMSTPMVYGIQPDRALKSSR